MRKLGPFWIAVGWIVLIVLVAILAPWLPIKDPESTSITASAVRRTRRRRSSGSAPTSGRPRHVLADYLGRAGVAHRRLRGDPVRDVIGGTLGISPATSGDGGIRLSFVFLVLLSFPALVLAILITTLLDRSLFTISATLGFLAIALVGRVAPGDDDPVQRA